MRQVIRGVVKATFPNAHRWAMRRWGRGGKDYRAAAALDGIYKGKVLEGPFSGMRYVDEAVGSALFPKMIGCYEQELHPVIEEIITRKYDTIVDVGSAEGYYAVGLAMRQSAREIYAYDIDDTARNLCRQMAERNGVADRLRVRERCDWSELEAVLPPSGGLVLCDCEGFELELLDPEKAPILTRADILVELHDFIIPGVKERVCERFRDTHDIRLIASCDRPIGSRTEFKTLRRADQVHALGERPCTMEWGWFTVKRDQSAEIASHVTREAECASV